MTEFNYFALIQKYIPVTTPLYGIYVTHVTLVTNKALKIARKLNLNKEQLIFIEEAGMLHDIGVVKVKSPKLGTTGDLPYICHGNEGRKILEAEGLMKHALVAERHTGVGITVAEIHERQLPIPERDMVPTSIEETIISYADLFFSKRPELLWEEESVAAIEAELAGFGQGNVDIFNKWHKQFAV